MDTLFVLLGGLLGLGLTVAWWWFCYHCYSSEGGPSSTPVAPASPASPASLLATHPALRSPPRCRPHRPTIDPAWRTDTVMTLARQIASGHDFTLAPILADALADAGCEKEYLLQHLRDTTIAHCRDCWVVHLLLQGECPPA